MLNAIRLGNFKAFADAQRVPVRPITLIFGANSAGKSSIIHSLALAHEAMKTGELDTHRTEVGGESIDLGGFRQYVHARDANKRVEWTIEIDTAQFTGRLGELFASARTVQLAMTIGMHEIDERQQTLFGDPKQVRVPRVGVETCEILADDRPLVTMSARRGGLLRIDRLDLEHPVSRQFLKAIVLLSTTAEEVREEDFAGIDEAVDALVPEMVVKLERFLPHMDARLSTEQETKKTPIVPVEKGNRREDLAKAVRMFLPRSLRDLINGVSEAVNAAVDRLQYLGPLRSYPPRHLAFAAHHDPNWHAGGGSTWDVLRRDAAVRAAVNQWLSSKERFSTWYEVIVRDLVAVDQLDEPLRDAIEAIQTSDGLAIEYEPESDHATGGAYPIIKDVDEQVENFKTILSDADIDRFTELVFIDRRSDTVVTHRDVGIGVSQVLPVLVNAFGLREKLIAIEQPEIHLHPALQAELGDVFIESALGERRNTFLLETHSEHLILRILRRVRETTENALPPGANPVRPEDIAVLYVEPDEQGSGSRVLEIPVTADGEFARPWPSGFFAERARELM